MDAMDSDSPVSPESLKTSRRDFIKSAAAAAVGATTFSGPAIFADGVSPNAKFNLGMIGVGGKGATNVALFAPLKLNLVSICDVDIKNCEKIWNSSKANKYFDYREMLEKENLDLVVVSTPDHHHAPASIMAMKKGLHVYCEKPMAHSLYEARRMAEVAREMKVATQMGNQGHAGRILRRAVEIVKSGAIGKVREFHAWTDRPSWPQGMDKLPDAEPVPETLKWDLWLGQATPRDYSHFYLPRDWRGWWDFGTGSLGDMGCHVVDLGFWALDLGVPTAVEAESKGTPFSPPKPGVVKFEFAARGELPPVTLTWYDGGRKPDPALVGLTELPGNGSILVGDEGTMYVPDTYGAKYVLLPEEKYKDYVYPAPQIPVPKSHYAEWSEAAAGGAPSMSSFDGYGGLLTETILLGNLANRIGGRIEWDAENLKAKNRPEADAFIKPEMREGWRV